MAERVKGEFILDSNYDISIRKPLDARSLVPAYESLTIKDNWIIDGKVAAYNGMIVSVANTSDASKNGLYFLFDPNCTSKLKSPNVEDAANWHKIGENSDISAFANRLTQIEADLADLDTRIDTLESKVTQIYDTYNTFATIAGIEGKLYVALDTGKTYIWINLPNEDGKYICIGDDTESYTIICGGDATAE